MAFVSTLPILFSFSQWTLSALLAFIRSIRKSRREVVDEQCRRGVVSLIVEAIAKLRSRSCIIDGEAVACGEDGIASFDRIRYRRHDADVFMWSFCPSCVSFDSAFLEGAFLFFATRMSASSQNRVLCHRSPLPVPCERTRRAALGRPSSQRAF
jgi:hypothetical protein